MIQFTCPCCEVACPPHRDGCEFHQDCPTEAEVFDEVSSMRAEITRLREERRWIPVGERLPDSSAILASDGDVVVEARHYAGYGFETIGGDELWFLPTHWMPLPAPPNGGEAR